MRALITGITGFAGSHLAEFLLAEHPDVEVFGTYRWRSRMENIEHVRSKVKLLETDLRDYTSVHNALDRSRPDFIFHLAAQSFVPSSWTAPNETLTTNVSGQTNIFEAIRALGKINPQSPEVVLALVEAIRQENILLRTVTVNGVTTKSAVTVRGSATEILSALGPESVQVIPKLIENLEFQNKRVDRGVSKS